MADVDMSTTFEQGTTPFYDPYYRPGTPKTQSEETMMRWYDDFSVFNLLHFPKSKVLSFDISMLSPAGQEEEASPYVSRQKRSGVLVAAKKWNNNTQAQGAESLVVKTNTLEYVNSSAAAGTPDDKGTTGDDATVKNHVAKKDMTSDHL
ncbi:hypothetical protein CY35_03G117500 [Sphagnum magellanicum]|nr:hypothetical protein CY35_03G117500 [Sphagnum magellanicum]